MVAEEQLKLIDPTEKLESEYREMLDEFLSAREYYHQNERDAAVNDFPGFVRKLRERPSGAGLPDGYVPDNTYWLVCGGRVLGTSRLRHRLTPKLEHEDGHIGYDIRPSERRKGYATRLLSMTLEKARSLGLSRVLVTCDSDNIASARVIEKNGGRLEDKRISRETGKLKLRYWIELSGKGG
jgi:predicted acetyltransferase